MTNFRKVCSCKPYGNWLTTDFHLFHLTLIIYVKVKVNVDLYSAVSASSLEPHQGIQVWITQFYLQTQNAFTAYFARGRDD